MKHDVDERQFVGDIEERETLSLKIVSWSPGTLYHYVLLYISSKNLRCLDISNFEQK